MTVVKGKDLSDRLVPPVRVEEIIDGEVDLSWLFGLGDVNIRALRKLSAVEVAATERRTRSKASFRVRRSPARPMLSRPCAARGAS